MRLFFVLLLLFTAGAARAGDTAPPLPPELEGAPLPLALALQKLMQDQDHWAFTQTTQMYDRDGRPDGGPQVEHYDPSRPDDQQWTLVLRKGKTPTDREVRSWKKKKEKEMRRREEKSLGEVMDVAKAQVASETEGLIVYEVPLKKTASRRLPADKFVVFMSISREKRQLEHFALRAREAFRLIGVARIDKVEVDAHFATVDEKYAAQPSVIQASGTGKVLFIRVGGSAEIKWSDFKRVTPYKDRFVVELGELKVLDF